MKNEEIKELEQSDLLMLMYNLLVQNFATLETIKDLLVEKGLIDKENLEQKMIKNQNETIKLLNLVLFRNRGK